MQKKFDLIMAELTVVSEAVLEKNEKTDEREATKTRRALLSYPPLTTHGLPRTCDTTHRCFSPYHGRAPLSLARLNVPVKIISGGSWPFPLGEGSPPPPNSQPTAYRAHATQPTVPSAKRPQSAPAVCRRSAREGGSGAALWAAHPHTRPGRAGRACGVRRARRTRGSRRGSPQPGSRAAAPTGAQPPPPPRAAAGCCPAHAKKSA